MSDVFIAAAFIAIAVLGYFLIKHLDRIIARCSVAVKSVQQKDTYSDVRIVYMDDKDKR